MTKMRCAVLASCLALIAPMAALAQGADAPSAAPRACDSVAQAPALPSDAGMSARMNAADQLVRMLDECAAQVSRDVSFLLEAEDAEFDVYDARLETLRDSTQALYDRFTRPGGEIEQLRRLRGEIASQRDGLERRFDDPDRVANEQARLDRVIGQYDQGIGDLEAEAEVMLGTIVDLIAVRPQVAYELRVARYEEVAASVDTLVGGVRRHSQEMRRIIDTVSRAGIAN